MGLNTQYANELHQQFGYLATWLPTAHLELGDYGTIKDGVFERGGNLKDLGIKFAAGTHADAGDLEYASADAVSQELKAAGNAPVTAGPGGSVDATVGISFKRANAVLLQASNCKTSIISNIDEVAHTVLSRYAEGEWPDDRVVITDLMSVGTLTVLISSGANAEIDLSVKGNVGSGVAKLASANASYSATKVSSIGTRIIGQKGATPLFKARGIKRSLFGWGSPKLQEKELPGDLFLAPISIRELVGPPPDLAG
jgi:hypothetical protein